MFCSTSLLKFIIVMYDLKKTHEKEMNLKRNDFYFLCNKMWYIRKNTLRQHGAETAIRLDNES